jgi:hypothetical protein
MDTTPNTANMTSGRAMPNNTFGLVFRLAKRLKMETFALLIIVFFPNRTPTDIRRCSLRAADFNTKNCMRQRDHGHI